MDAAHDNDMYVLLDIIYNHAGNVFFYNRDGNPESQMPYRFQPPYAVHGWRSESGASTQQPVSVEDAVLPEEFQSQGVFTRAGRIGRFDPEPWENPLHPLTEFRRGDFFDLKNIELDNAQLSAVIDVYRDEGLPLLDRVLVALRACGDEDPAATTEARHRYETYFSTQRLRKMSRTRP